MLYECLYVQLDLKSGPSDLGTKFYKNTNKISLYSQSLLIFIHKTSVVENHPTTTEIRDLLRPTSTPTGNTVCFYTRKICDAMHHGSRNVLDYNFKNISVTLTLYHTVQF